MGIMVICITVIFFTFIITLSEEDFSTAVDISLIPLALSLIIGVPMAACDPTPEYYIENKYEVKAISQRDTAGRYDIYLKDSENSINVVENIKADIISDDVKNPTYAEYKSDSEMYFSSHKSVIYIPRNMELSEIMAESE